MGDELTTLDLDRSRRLVRKDNVKMIVAGIIVALTWGFALGVAVTFVSVKNDNNESWGNGYEIGWRDAMGNVKEYVDNDEVLNDYFDFDYQVEV